ncbi:MAG: polysaccharide biosynthesis tyrosine autokinase [Pseudomonadaceae bacterium]|nr:polysaccharide biosynthesis tyrosine autokinase [Pseudomonadaceae bacterium]
MNTQSPLQNSLDFNLADIIALLRRRWTLLVGCTLGILVLAALLLALTPPQYSAQGMLQINTRQQQVMGDVQDVLSAMDVNDAAIRSEVDIIRSRKLARRVVEELGLEASKDLAGGGSLLGALVGGLKGLVMPAKVETLGAAESAKTTHAVNAFLSRLEVAVVPRSYSIQITYTSYNPQTAAAVVNRLAQEYLNSQMEDRLDAARRATNWMGDRAKTLQKRVQASELAERIFREEHNLTEAKGVALSEQQMSELNSQLILARTQLAEAQAKANNSGAARNSSEVLNSPLIQNLRLQETEVRRQLSDLSARYGARHPKMVTVGNELADLQRKISEESAKIRGSMQNDVSVAQARVNTLQAQLLALQKSGRLSNDAEVQLAELVRQAQSDRTLYESFLNRSKEIAQMDFARSDARVVSDAEVPLAPSKPKKSLIMLLAAFVGLGLGVALALLLEALDNGFRTAEQLEASTKLPVLGMLAELPANQDLVHTVTEKPNSAYTEAVRAIRTSLGFAKPDADIKVILVTSSVPQEGKSQFAASLAQVAAMGGKKVLLMDADMRRPTQAGSFGLEPEAGLAEVLAGSTSLQKAIQKLPEANLSLLPALPNTQFAQELLASARMKTLMAELRKHFDTVIIDSPPVMAVADPLTLSELADASLYMVRWGETPRPLAATGLRQLAASKLGVTGLVLTRVDMARQKSYGMGEYGFYYGKYQDYYSN